MKIQIKNYENIKFERGRIFVIPFFSAEKINIENKEIKKELEGLDKEIKELRSGEWRFFILPSKNFFLFNAGEKAKWSQRKLLLNVRKIIRHLKTNHFAKIVLCLESLFPANADKNNLIRQIVENVLIAQYDFLFFKKKSQVDKEIKEIDILIKNPQNFQKDLGVGKIIGNAVNFARDLSNIPGGIMTPSKFTDTAQKIFKKIKNISIEIFDEKKLKALKMGGILGVSQGSSEKPRMLILKYSGNKKDKKTNLVFVGKGITFDSGGIQIKPSESFSSNPMFLDMSGGASVMGAMLAISQLKPFFNIIGIVPLAENMPSGASYRPGDVLKSYNGTTIEVKNTDAEGRIVLADAFSYAIKNFKPEMIVDVATLTGAALATFSDKAIALLTNVSKLENFLKLIGENSGDYVWPLPLWEEFEEELKSQIADISNIGVKKYGGTIVAAMFLKNFVENTNWVHLDIASTMVSGEENGLASGSPGSGLRFLVELVKNYKKIKSEF